MFSLFILLFERVGLIILIAYLLLNMPSFKQKLTNRKKGSTQALLILIFGLFAIISNFSGIEIQNGEVSSNILLAKLSEQASSVNTRTLTIGISGITGGPIVGIAVGAISGIVRFYQGGIDPQVYVFSSLFIGLAAGLYGQKFIKKESFPLPAKGALMGAGVEMIQMACILLFSSSFTDAWQLVRFIILPMTLINSFGVAVFLSIIHTAQRQELQARAIQTHDVLELANATLPYFRSGLDERSCKKAAEIIKKFMKVSAVSITDKEQILAHVGVGSDHHLPSHEISTDLSHDVLHTGEIKEAHSHEEIGCDVPGCLLEAAIVIPLKTAKGIVGTLKLYFTDAEELTFVERQLAEGLGNIFSSQIELGEAEVQARLLQDAEIKSLQAQVNPHFFFNAINTISALIRVDSEKARKLLIQLSQFFRSNLQGARKNLIPLEKELEQVKSYQLLEQARFPDRYTVHLEIEEGLEKIAVPPFIVQILVENAFKHAFRSRKTDNHVWINISKKEDGVNIQVQDNGTGLPDNIVQQLGKEVISSQKGTGSALENLNRRLVSLFGEKACLTFDSSQEGTLVSCLIPMKKESD
ncbi:sensor histidine kinase [Tetragenococcus halophilus]|uniref:sensor histidine kinase n=1 Tax=Tetragenococcus halophilus TaxID=51669 RepID=UPI002565C0C8|nr:sensor histidine kinase [Tetragenococcus halophilus]GMG60360.1 sensor histidine kinase [Tetragenococcus halophilus]GMG63372.1 sensor histidine kinase [Tetragenococcus halophilus]